MAEKTVSFEFQYKGNLINKVREVTTEMKGLSKTTRTYENGMLKSSTRTKRFGGELKGLAMRFVGLQAAFRYGEQAIRSLIGWVGDSINKFREFEVRIAEVGTILGKDTYDQIDRLSAGVQVLSINFGQATSDMAKGLYDIMSAAFDAEDAIGLLNTATKASIAGLSTVRESVDIFTTVLNTYGMTAAQAANVSDILFQSVVRGKFQFRDLESSLGYVVPIAAQAGIRFSELMAALSTATRHGLHLDMTARGLALAIQNVVSPTEKAKKVAQEYGIDMSALSLRIDGLVGFFHKLNEATHEFGRGIISELIPNMRSLRVAMVLAGDEGLEGFEEDLLLVKDAAGRTEEALAKMINTAQRQAEILTQQLEYAERKVGEAWSGFELWWRKTKVWWGTFLSGGDADASVRRVEDTFQRIKDSYINQVMEPFEGEGGFLDVGSIDAYIDAFKEAEKISAEIKKVERELFGMGESPFSIEKGFLKVKEGYDAEEVEKKVHDIIRYYSGDLTQNLEDLTWEINNNQNAFDKATGRLDDYTTELEKLETDLIDIENELDNLNEELTENITYGWGTLDTLNEEITENITHVWGTFQRTASIAVSELTSLTEEQREKLSQYGDTIKGTLGYEFELLKAEQTHADLIHDINMGLEDETYLWKTQNTELKNAVTTVREYEHAQESQRKEMEKTNLVIEENNLEIMKLQLRGMMRRRGLTRSEERRMKNLRIMNLQERISAEDNAERKTVSELDAYQKAKEIIDKRIRDANEVTYQMKYNYDQQIADLSQEIFDEAVLLDTRKQQWEDTLTSINKTAFDKMQDLTKILMEAPGLSLFIDAAGMKKALASYVKKYENYSYAPSGGTGGMTYKTVPKTGLTNAVINMLVKVGNINTDVDINRVASMLGLGIKAELINADGTSKYDMR